jgi:hypothetical protein
MVTRMAKRLIVLPPDNGMQGTPIEAAFPCACPIDRFPAGSVILHR